MPRSRASNTSSPMYLSRGALTIVHNSAEQSFGRAKIGTFLPSPNCKDQRYCQREGIFKGRAHFAKQLAPPLKPISLVRFLFGNKK